MYKTNGAAERARWAVVWVYKTKQGKKRLYRKDFGDDLASAEELYHKALRADKLYATLVCLNMGFPPPANLRPKAVVKRGRDRRTGKIRTVRAVVDPLKELNMQGILWCPRCRTKREFVFSRHAVTGGVQMEYPRYICPICKISHRDHNVSQYNPTAALHMQNTLDARQRPSKGLRRRRRSRS